MGRSREIADTAERVVKIVLIYGIGAAGILLGFASPLGTAIYHSAEAALYIRVMAPLIPIMYLDTAVDSILKGLGEQVYTMRVNIVDAFVSVIAVWFLVPRLGLGGYIAVIFISELINFSFSFVRMVEVTGTKGALFRLAAKPILAISCAVFGAGLLTEWLVGGASSMIRAIVGILLSVLGYGFLLPVLRVLPLKPLTAVLKKLRFPDSRHTAASHNP